MTRYPLERLYEEVAYVLYEEVAYVAYYFHWGREEILHMEHTERARWVREIARINGQLSEGIT
jgi:hypothetical protein